MSLSASHAEDHRLPKGDDAENGLARSIWAIELPFYASLYGWNSVQKGLRKGEGVLMEAGVGRGGTSLAVRRLVERTSA